VTDLGMTGPYKDAIIGGDKENILYHFLTATRIKRWETGKSDTCFNSVLFKIDTDKRRTLSVERIDRIIPKNYLER
jgi:calcineurin-like phosphoesterase